MTDINSEYTASDHAARDNDVYALAKYHWTIRKIKTLGLSTDARIANIGCGSGTFTRLLSEAGYKVFATEPDLAAFEIAERNCPPNCEVKPFGLFEIEQNGQFNLIVMHDVLEHIDAESAAISKISELLAPGGYFVATVPALEQLFGHHDLQLGHFRRYSRASMRRLLSSNFQIRTIRYFGFVSIPITYLLSRRLRRDYPQLGQGGMSIIQRCYALICEAETYIRVPLGTAVLAIAQRK